MRRYSCSSSIRHHLLNEFLNDIRLLLCFRFFRVNAKRDWSFKSVFERRSINLLCMAEPQGSDIPRRKGTGKRASPSVEAATSAPAPCGACKFLRRKCVSGCIFAPHFGSDQGAARFAAVHKVFGASNVSKLLLHIPVNRRHDAVITISYEAQARLSDPVYGCVSTILALQQQVATLQAELALVQTQLMNSRYNVANALQSSQLQQEQVQLQQNLTMLQPAYSNNSSTSNNLVKNIANLASTFDLVAHDNTTAPSSQSFEPLQLSSLPLHHDDEDEEEESRNPIMFADEFFHRG